MTQRSSDTGTDNQPAIDRGEDVPGPTYNPAANMLMADMVIRTGSYALRTFVEGGLLKGRYDPKTARDIVKNRPASHKLASFAIAKLASKSLPGAALVGTGLLGRSLYSRGKAIRKARRAGDAKLLEQAED